jgi:hypothetical protein
MDILDNNIHQICNVVLITWITMFKKFITKHIYKRMKIIYKLQIPCLETHFTQTHPHVFFKETSNSVSFINLEGERQPMLRSFGYFFLININLFK